MISLLVQHIQYSYQRGALCLKFDCFVSVIVIPFQGAECLVLDFWLWQPLDPCSPNTITTIVFAIGVMSAKCNNCNYVCKCNRGCTSKILKCYRRLAEQWYVLHRWSIQVQIIKCTTQNKIVTIIASTNAITMVLPYNTETLWSGSRTMANNSMGYSWDSTKGWQIRCIYNCGCVTYDSKYSCIAPVLGIAGAFANINCSD